MRLIAGQYKVIRLLHSKNEYAAVQAVDILDRQKSLCLLNIYKGKTAQKYAKVFSHLNHCPEFIGIKTEKDVLIAIFKWNNFPDIDQVFFANSKQDYKTRLLYAKELFTLLLSLWDQPFEIGCSAMKNGNLCIMPLDMKLKVNYCVIPEENLNGRELICLAADQAEKILLCSFESVISQRRFVLELTGGRWSNAINLNSAWNDYSKEIEKEYQTLEEKGFLARSFFQLLNNIRWNMKKKENPYAEKK